MYACAFVTWHVCGGQRRDLGACLSLSPCEHQLRWAVAVPTQPKYTNGEETLKQPKGKLAFMFQRQEMTPI